MLHIILRATLRVTAFSLLSIVLLMVVANSAHAENINFKTTKEILFSLEVCFELQVNSEADYENQSRGLLWESMRCENMEAEALANGITQQRIIKLKNRVEKTARNLRDADCRRARAEGLEDACLG